MQDPSGTEETSPLRSYIEEWLRDKEANWDWLVKQSGVAGGTQTRIRRGIIPKTDTLRKIAQVMQVKPATLFLLAGYIQREDLEGAPNDLTPDEEGLLEDYRALPHRYRRTARRVVRALRNSDDD